MLRFFSGTNWLLMLSLLFGSAALSVLGDSLGSKYGKKRITLFGLRPRYTSRIITAITGALIAVGVLAVVSVLSQDVRTALFGMKLLRQQLNQSEEEAQQARINLAEASASLDLTGFELSTMRNDKLILEQQKRELETELTLMREESETLRQDLKAMKSETIALSANLLLAQRAFEAGLSREEVIDGMNALKQAVRLNVLERVSNQSFTRLREFPVVFDADEEEAVINDILSADMRQYVRAVTAENYTAVGNIRIMVHLTHGTSILLYREGLPVYRKFFMNDRTARRATPEDMLHTFLRELRAHVIDGGILPEPSTGNVGTLGGEEFFDAVDALEAITEPVIITALAGRDIYTEGPVMIDIIFEE